MWIIKYLDNGISKESRHDNNVGIVNIIAGLDFLISQSSQILHVSKNKNPELEEYWCELH
jgi:hypothetical protein